MKLSEIVKKRISLPHRRGVMTRRVYRFEEKYLSTLKELNKQRSLRELTAVAESLWKKYYRGKRKMPTIRFGAGDCSLGYPLSYTEGYSTIELCPGQQNLMVMIHELTHAIGPSQHGIAFTRAYVNILDDFIDDEEVRQKIYDDLITKHGQIYRRLYKNESR